MKKYYNVEIAYNTREMINRVNNFRMWLYDNNIKHEISSAGDFVHFVHFEILLSSDEVAKVNNALDNIVWFDGIVNEQGVKQVAGSIALLVSISIIYFTLQN